VLPCTICILKIMKQSIHSILEITGVVLMHQKTVGCILKTPCACLLGHIAWRLHLMVIEGSSNLHKYFYLLLKLKILVNPLLWVVIWICFNYLIYSYAIASHHRYRYDHSASLLVLTDWINNSRDSSSVWPFTTNQLISRRTVVCRVTQKAGAPHPWVINRKNNNTIFTYT